MCLSLPVDNFLQSNIRGFKDSSIFFLFITSWCIRTLIPREFFCGLQVVIALSSSKRTDGHFQVATGCRLFADKHCCWEWWLLDPVQFLSIPCSLFLLVSCPRCRRRHRNALQILQPLCGVQWTTAKDKISPGTGPILAGGTQNLISTH